MFSCIPCYLWSWCKVLLVVDELTIRHGTILHRAQQHQRYNIDHTLNSQQLRDVMRGVLGGDVYASHDDVIKWKHFPHYWPFVLGIHRSPMNSPHKGQWCGALMFSLICAWINGWVNKGKAGDLRRHGAYYDVTVMFCNKCLPDWRLLRNEWRGVYISRRGWSRKPWNQD